MITAYFWLIFISSKWFTIIRGFTKFGIKVSKLQFLLYLRTLRLKFQKAPTKIWGSQLGRLRTTSILVRTFWNFGFTLSFTFLCISPFKHKVLKYSKNCSPLDTLKSKNHLNPLTIIYLLLKPNLCIPVFTKGHLISKANFLVVTWTEKWTKLFFVFCPSL